MYKNSVRQENFSEGSLSASNTKNELPYMINEESKRTNIDTAKKRAVAQGMDYDGFKQMVLGANLKPIKAGDVTKITEKKVSVLNSASTNSGQDQQALEKLPNVNYSLEIPKNSLEFEKYFIRKLSATADRYEYLKIIPIDSLEKLFGSDIDIDVLLKIVETFTDALKDSENAEILVDVHFALEFMRKIGVIKALSMGLSFLSEKEQKAFVSLFNSMKKPLIENNNEELANDIEEVKCLYTKYFT